VEISFATTRAELAAIVVSKLQHHKITSVVLVGGSVVSLYTNNRYETRDLDFITSADHRKIHIAMLELGFTSAGKDFVHANTDFTVEFPSGPLAIGDDVPVLAEGSITVNGVVISLLSPTQSVMDRLMSFFLYNDRQCLEQAVLIAHDHSVDLDRVAAWATREKYTEKLKVFLLRNADFKK